MNNVNLVVMGKTGSGKSTLINTVLDEDLAPTGIGQTITKENKIYSRNMMFPSKINTLEGGGRTIEKQVNLYDTVGLEIDFAITQNTLKEIKGYIKSVQLQDDESDISLVWFCINCRCSRFETVEIELLRSLSIEYEIPFILVLTQCYDKEQGELEMSIQKDFPEIPVVRLVAKDYRMRNGSVVSSYGVSELLEKSIWDYDKTKVHILESKLLKLSDERKNRIAQLRKKGMACVDSYSNVAIKVGLIPAACIPIVHGQCIAMIAALNKIVGIQSSKGFASDIFASAVVGVIATPFMAVPLLSALVAGGYIAAVGETYLDSLMSVISHSTDEELKNNDLMAERIKKELKKRSK